MERDLRPAPSFHLNVLLGFFNLFRMVPDCDYIVADN